MQFSFYKPFRTIFATALCLSAFSALAQTSPFPTKPVTIMVTYPAGGASDASARILAKELPGILGQPVVVENVPGAGGSIGMNKAMAAPADGHMLILSSPTEAILAPLIYKSAQYKADDVRTIAMVGITDLMLVVRKGLAANTLPELIALLKTSEAKPLSYCSVGRGSVYHLLTERFHAISNTKGLHVPYTGFAQCLTDLSGGQIDFALLPVGGPFPGFVDNGSIRALATFGDVVNVRLPKVPMAKQTKGFEDIKLTVWAGVHVSGKVSDAVALALNKAVFAATAKPDVRKAIETMGGTLSEPMTPAQAHAAYMKEVQIYQSMARAAGIEPQ